MHDLSKSDFYLLDFLERKKLTKTLGKRKRGHLVNITKILDKIF